MSAPDSNPPKSDADFEAMLSLASQTLQLAPGDPDDMLKQLRQVSAMIGELAVAPTEPALVFRQQGRADLRSIGDALTVGRAGACGVAFQGLGEMSRRQFTVTREGEAYVITDPGSLNGTFVRGVQGRVRRRELRDGDVIEAGGVVFVFVRPE